jgi:hypothetical protein
MLFSPDEMKDSQAPHIEPRVEESAQEEEVEAKELLYASCAAQRATDPSYVSHDAALAT